MSPRHIHVLLPTRWIEDLFWSAILAVSNCVIRVLDAWEPEFPDESAGHPINKT
jgi:hypothetical protein